LASAVLVLLLAAPGFSAGAEEPTGLETAKEKLDSITQQVDGVTAERHGLDAELNGLLAQIATRQREMRGIQADLETTAGRVAALGSAIRSRQEALNRRAAEVYMTPPVGILDVVLSAQSLSDADDVLYFMEESARSDADLILQLDSERTTLGGQQARLGGLRNEAQTALDRLDRLAAELGDRLALQRALADQLARDRGEAAALVAQPSEKQHEPSPPAPEPDPDPPMPPDPGPQAVKAFIADYFAPLGQKQVDIALCVAEAESGFDPHAENPYTGAAGVFQFIPTTWASLSEAAGWGGSSVFDAEANVAVAAWTVEYVGWGPWPVAESCGA
jgi:peptidoglycan hydrolase CwlO-like protein